MSGKKIMGSNATHYAKIYHYPCGVMDIIASTSPDFKEAGWEESAGAWDRPQSLTNKPPRRQEAPERRGTDEAKAEDTERSMRRARARVRRLALANEFRWFVTLTLDPKKIDRYDAGEVVRKLSQWASNQVKRHGLRYILVPERHKDGALHFHGFFNDVLEAAESGHRTKDGRMIYNLPAWTLGFTAAIELYGTYPGAVAYVCKYIGKQGEKPAGRWYYSGGELNEPETDYAEISPEELRQQFKGKAFTIAVPGRELAIVNGVEGWEKEEMSAAEYIWRVDEMEHLIEKICNTEDEK